MHWMYAIAFCLIIFGLLIYFLTSTEVAEAEKPWLGENQEKGIIMGSVCQAKGGQRGDGGLGPVQ